MPAMDTPARWQVSHMAARLAVPLALATGVVMVALTPRHLANTVPTTYSDLGPWVALVDRVAAASLVAAGVLAWFTSTHHRAGLLAMTGGLLWLMPQVIGWRTGDPALRTVAALLAPWLTLVLAGLLAEMRHAPNGRSGHRTVFAALTVITAIASVGFVVGYDHLRDPGCWTDCTRAPLVDLGSTAAVRWVETLVSLAVGLSAILLAAESWRWVTTRAGLGRHPRATMTLAAMVYAVATLAVSAVVTLRLMGIRPFGLRLPVEHPDVPEYALLFWIRAVALVMLGCGLAWWVLAERRTAMRVRQIAAALEAAPAPGSLEAVLRVALADPSLRVLYWLDHAGLLVDASGDPAEEPDSASAGSVTSIERDGRRVALVVNASHSDIPALQRELGAAALAAVDNERLRAAVLFQISQLRASRVRVVEMADKERRRLERDLHDGAQQRLLAISYDLRMARAAAASAGDVDLVSRLTCGQEDIGAAVEELRQLAHGIHPAILTEAGLVVALGAMAEDSPVVLEVDGEHVGARCPAPVEAAAYQLVSESAVETDRRGGSRLQVMLSTSTGLLTVEASSDAEISLDDLVRAADRVWAAGGKLEGGPVLHGLGSFVRAELPCG